jgi:hypothetical protein
MNPRHAAALALVGWYLMVPPMYRTADGDLLIGLSRPLYNWTTSRTYDSAEECRQDAALLAQPKGGPQNKVFFFSTEGIVTNDDAAAVIKLLTRHAQCIATDDPRLKEK